MDNDAPKLARDVAQAHAGKLIFGIRESLNELIAIRIREHGEVLEVDEGALMAVKNSLDWLLNDIRETRAAKSRKLLMVK
jgi:hypothetical protein